MANETEAQKRETLDVDPNSSPDFEDKTEPQQNLSGIRCSRILANQMQCPRTAVRVKPEDKTGREAVCFVCWSLEGEPADYSVVIGVD